MFKYIYINEIKNIKWIICIALLITYFFGVTVYDKSLTNSYLEFVKMNGNYHGMENNVLLPKLMIINVLFIVFLVFIQNFSDNKFMTSFPYKKSELYMAKILSGITLYFVVFIFYLLMSCFVYDKYSFMNEYIIGMSNLEPYYYNCLSKSYLIYTIFFMSIYLIMLYVIYMFFQKLCKNSLVGIIFASLVVFIPVGLSFLFGLRYYDSVYDYYKNFFTSIIPFSVVFSENDIQLINQNFDGIEMTGFELSINYYNNIFEKSVFCIFIICFLLLCIHLISSNDKQIYSDKKIIYNWASVLFILTLIFWGIVLGVFWTNFVFDSLKYAGIFVLICIVAAFFIGNKFTGLLKLSKRR